MMAIICLETGWDYEKYLNQPSWLIDLICIKLKVDSKSQKK